VPRGGRGNDGTNHFCTLDIVYILISNTLASMSGNKSGSQCQLNGFTGDAGGNRLKKDTLSGRDLVPFFSDSESAVKSEKQIVNSSVKAKVIRANGAPVPFPLLPTPYQFMPRSGSPPPAVSSRRVHHPEGLYAGTTLDTPPSP
jgi:hypothetical protein